MKWKEKEREWQSVSLAWPAEHHRADFFFSSKKAEFGTFTAVMPFLESFLTRERDRERLQSQTWRPPILFAVVCVPQVIRCLTIPSQPHPPNTHILQNLVYLTATPHTTGLSLCTPQTPCQKVTTKKLWPQQWSWRSRLETSPLALEVTHLNSQHVLKSRRQGPRCWLRSPDSGKLHFWVILLYIFCPWHFLILIIPSLGLESQIKTGVKHRPRPDVICLSAPTTDKFLQLQNTINHD